MMSPLNSSMFRRLAMLVVAAIALSRAPLSAHDMWIEPTTFSPESGEIVGVRLRVGQDLLGDPLPRDPALINQFVVEDATGRKPVVGRDGADPAGFVRVATPGLLVIGYRSNPSAVELAADKFNQYLKEEGLDAVAALRARRNETGAKAHELFSRCAKSLVLSGSPSEAQGDRPLGFHARTGGRTESVRDPRRSGSSRSPDVREPSARGRARRCHEPSEPFREAVGSHRQRRPCAIPVAAGRDVAGQSRTYDSGACRLQRRVGELLGVAHVRTASHKAPRGIKGRRTPRGDKAKATRQCSRAFLRSNVRYGAVRLLAQRSGPLSSRSFAAQRFARMRSARRACRSSFRRAGRTTSKS